MCTCTHVHIYLCIGVSHTHTFWIDAFKHTQKRTCMYTRMHTRMHVLWVHTYMYAYAWACMHAYVLVQIQSCMISSRSTGWPRLTWSLIFIGHFPQRWPIFSGSFVENDLQLMGSYESLPPCTSVTHSQDSAKRRLPLTKTPYKHKTTPYRDPYKYKTATQETATHDKPLNRLPHKKPYKRKTTPFKDPVSKQDELL